MHRPTPPLPKGGVVWHSQTGGIPQACRFPHRFVLLGKCLLWNPSVTAYAVPAPFNKGAFFIRYRSMVRCRAFSCFQSTAWERNTPKYHNPKRGQRLKPTTRAKAKGQSRMVPPGGFLRGEQFERERVVPPLSRLLCLLSCRSKKVRPRWQAPGVPPVSISLGS